MDAPQVNFISRVGIQARTLRATFALSEELKTLYSGTPNWNALITQAEIDSVPSFQQAGLTKLQIDGVVYSLGIINAQITTFLTEFVMLATI